MSQERMHGRRSRSIDEYLGQEKNSRAVGIGDNYDKEECLVEDNGKL